MSWLKDYFSFSKRERNAFIGLLIIIAAFIFLPSLFTPQKIATAVSPEVKKTATRPQPSSGNSPNDDESWQTPFTAPDDPPKGRLFVFDPNTLSLEGFMELGLPERTAKTIINYRNKGGQFRKPEELRKIYSLKKEDADRIIPYAKIELAVNYQHRDYPNTKNNYYTKPKTIAAIDINTATAEEWKSLPGIGEVFSARIIQFRERIGGFSSISQVAKTYGLPDSVFQKILPYLLLASPAENKININTAYENELRECPAITKDIAQAIIIYRKQHGSFQKPEELKNIVFINEETYRSILPCIKLN